MMKLMKWPPGVHWWSSEDTLNTYEIYIKPVIEYETDILRNANKSRLKQLKIHQSNALRLWSGTLKTTVTAMQLYICCYPIKEKIRQQLQM